MSNPSENPAITTLGALKRRARSIKRALAITHTEALNHAAIEAGYANYTHAYRVLSAVVANHEEEPYVDLPAPDIFRAPPQAKVAIERRALLNPLAKRPVRLNQQVEEALGRILQRTPKGPDGFIRFPMQQLRDEIGPLPPVASFSARRRFAEAVSEAGLHDQLRKLLNVTVVKDRVTLHAVQEVSHDNGVVAIRPLG